MTIYDQDKERRLTRATRHGVHKAGRMLWQMRDDVHLGRADQVVAVADGAEWIAGLAERNLPGKTTVILDYYHASQHVIRPVGACLAKWTLVARPGPIRCSSSCPIDLLKSYGKHCWRPIQAQSPGQTQCPGRPDGLSTSGRRR